MKIMSTPKKKEEEKSFAFLFFVLVFLVVVVSVWALVQEADILRPWKKYQKEYYSLNYEETSRKLQAAIESFAEPEVQKEYQRLLQILDEREREFNNPQTQKKHKEITQRIKEADKEISLTDRDLLVARNRLLEQEYQFLRFKEDKSKKRIDELRQEINILENRKRESIQRRSDLKSEEEDYSLLLEQQREKRDTFPYLVEIENLDNILKSLENPKIEIKQYFIEGLDKVDRCTSCHIGIDSSTPNKLPPPFTSHPGYSIYLENHPPGQFGCTICHEGQGRATTSPDKAHGHVEFWSEPMFEGSLTQASCLHCHEDISNLRGAEVLAEGAKLLKKNVCFGCHRIDGYENIDKISPPLSRSGEKVSYTWLIKWLLNPSEMVEGATMPDFNFSEEDASAVADYLFSLTQKMRKDEPVNEDVDWTLYDKGKIIFSRSICSICHSANSRGGAYKDMFASDLSKVGSKINREWVKTWFSNPKSYFSKARMPHFRFSEEEILALSEYLSGEYVDWDLEEIKIELHVEITQSSIQRGAALIKEYGCFGCHDIEGMRDIDEIGPYLKIEELEELVADELNSIGDKPIEEFDFGKLHDFTKSRTAYLRQKLENPRAFRDDARMPQYNFTEDEIETLLTMILGFSKEEPLARYRIEKKLSDYQPTGEFAEILNDVKCLSCHKIYGNGADYAPDLSIEGSKITEEWLTNYLKSPDIIRPLSEQMPKFSLGKKMSMMPLQLSKDEVSIITEYIMTVLVSDEIPKDFLKGEIISRADIDKGQKIYFEKGCQACHQIGDEGGAVGPTLTTVGLRLKPGYIFKHLLNPSLINANTVEPDMDLSEEEALSLTKFLMNLRNK